MSTGAPPLVPLAQRVWLVLLQTALVLPFATVQSCGGGETRTYLGLELYFDPERLPLVFALVGVLVALIARPWTGARGPAEVVGGGLRAWVAVLGAFVAIFGPMVMFLFDTVEPRIGWFAHAAGWGLTALAYLGVALYLLAVGWAPADPGHPVPEQRTWTAIGLLVAAVPIAVVAKNLHDPDALPQALAVLAAGLTAVAPLVITGLGLIAARRQRVATPVASALWWLGVALTLAVCLAGAFAT